MHSRDADARPRYSACRRIDGSPFCDCRQSEPGNQQFAIPLHIPVVGATRSRRSFTLYETALLRSQGMCACVCTCVLRLVTSVIHISQFRSGQSASFGTSRNFSPECRFCPDSGAVVTWVRQPWWVFACAGSTSNMPRMIGSSAQLVSRAVSKGALKTTSIAIQHTGRWSCRFMFEVAAGAASVQPVPGTQPK